VITTAINYTSYFNNLSVVKEAVNANANQIPGIVKQWLGNDQINIHFTASDNQLTELKIILKNGIIETLDKGSNDNPDLEISISELVLNQIMSSKNPRAEIKAELNNNGITYKTHGFSMALGMTILKTLL